MNPRRAFLLSMGAGALAVLGVLAMSTLMGSLWSRRANESSGGIVAAPKVFSNARCSASYARLYEEPEIRITVAFGYKDARPSRFVADLYERALWVQTLTRKCQGAEDEAVSAVCGFVAVAETDGDYIRTQWVGPDGRRKRIRIRVLNGSIGPDDQINRRSQLQAAHSKRTWEGFLAALHEDHVVIYNGHSRNGGGPDFFPPQMNAVGVVDYQAYQSSPERLTEFLSAVGEGRKIGRLRLLGLLSCDSRQFFARKLGAASDRELPLLSSRKLMYFADSMAVLTEGVDALLKAKCQAEWPSKEAAGLGMMLENFF